MKKNVAGQHVGIQMTTAADGTDFTGAVTVHVTGDAGTQATGSVGSGACTHEGNGYHTYAPAQGETNYDMVAFTFTGTGAITATREIYTNFPQTADNSTALTTALTESYSTDGGTATATQLLFEINAMLQEKNATGTSLVVKKRDGTTAMTFTLDSATTPSTITRAS